MLSRFFAAAPRGMLISVAIAFVLLNGLGIWQLQRLKWKEGLISDLARTESMAPVPAHDLLAQTRPAWRSASLTCDLRPGDVIYMHSEVSGQPGYRLLTACPLDDGAVLVDLGFVTDKINIAPMTINAVGRLRPFEKPGMVTPVNRPADNDWYWRSAGDMGPALHARLRLDYFIVLDLAASHLAMPGLQQGPLTAPLPNRHMEYALTWFGLAWALIGMFIAYVRQKMHGK